MNSRLVFLKQHLLPALVCFGLALAIAQTEWLQKIENITLDARTRLRAKVAPTKPRDDVALVAIDQPSLNLFGKWPWNRGEVHGYFLRLLSRVKPTVMAWDILFDDPSEQDAAFADGIRKSG